jgi:signal transduction histidine kinase
MRQISLNEKLVVYFVVLGIAGIIVVQTVSFYQARKALLSRTFDQLTSVRANKKKQVEAFFDERMLEANLIAISDETQNILNSLSTIPVDEHYPVVFKPRLNQYFFSYLSISGVYSRIYLIDPLGKTFVLSTTEYKQDTLIGSLAGLGTKYASLYDNAIVNDRINFYNLTDAGGQPEPSIFVSSPVETEDGKSLLLMEFSFQEINRFMLQNDPNDGLGESGECYLIGDDKLMRSQSRFIEKSSLGTIVNTEGVNKALEKLTGISIINDYRGISVLCSYSSLNIPGLNWVIVGEIDTAEAMAPIYDLRKNVLFIGVLIALLIFIFAFILSRQITSPIVRLNRAAHQIAGGRFDIQLPVSSNDEIGELTGTFNHMARQLEQQKKALAEERKKSLRSMIDGQELERQRLSRDLHDGLGQSFIAIKLQLENFCINTANFQVERMEKIKTYFDQTIEEIRRMSNDLSPSVLDEFGLQTALRNLCLTFSEQSGINITFTSKGNGPTLSRKTKIYLYRISQEALSNAVKHSGADKIEVILHFEEKKINLQVNDNGKGFDTELAKKLNGNGLNNINERIQLLNGFLQIMAAPGKGTRMRIECKA